MSDEGNVTRFPGSPGVQELPENPLQLAPRPFKYCGHDAVLLDEHSRTVTCTECGALLDPFDYLRSNARTISSAWALHAHMRQEIAVLVERVDTLKKEEKRLRAMVKRLQEKSGAVLATRGKVL